MTGRPAHVAVFVFADYGHVNPSIQVTRELVARGHRVTYVAAESYRATVTAAGAQLVGYDAQRRRLSNRIHVGPEEIADIGLDILADTTARVLPAARAAFTGDDVPDLIFYDFESFTAARILARELNRPTVQYFPYMASNQQWSLHDETFVKDSEAVHRGVEAVMDVLSAVEPDPVKMWAMMAVSDTHNVVFLPRELQARGETFDETFTFVGHCLPVRRPEVSWDLPGSDVPVVLVSMGTESNERAGMFGLCADAFADKAWHVVMTLGRGNALDEGLSAVNIEAHEWLPHLAVLPHVSAFVSHGGMGSLTEALYHGVPVVVVPHTPENFVNARRIQEVGVGRMLHPADLSPRTLRAAVDELAADGATKARLAVMSAAMRAAGGPAVAADVIERVLAER